MITSLIAYLNSRTNRFNMYIFFLYLGLLPRAHIGNIGAHSLELHEENIGLT